MGLYHIKGIPIAMGIGGGHSEPITPTVEGHVQIFYMVWQIYIGLGS